MHQEPLHENEPTPGAGTPIRSGRELIEATMPFAVESVAGSWTRARYRAVRHPLTVLTGYLTIFLFS